MGFGPDFRNFRSDLFRSYYRDFTSDFKDFTSDFKDFKYFTSDFTVFKVCPVSSCSCGS